MDKIKIYGLVSEYSDDKGNVKGLRFDYQKVYSYNIKDSFIRILFTKIKRFYYCKIDKYRFKKTRTGYKLIF